MKAYKTHAYNNLFTLLFLLFVPLILDSQVPNGPGGVDNTSGTGNLHMWFRPESGITLTAGQVSSWGDQSGYANTLTGPAGFRTTTVTSAALNNRTVMRYSGAQYFSSGLMGPNVNSITIFLVANGTSYQSLVRFQNNPATYVVYPWEFGGANRTFISSSDGGTAAGIPSGLVTNANNVGAARYSRNTTNGMQTYLNGGINSQRNSVNAALPSQPFYSGRYNPGASEYPNCDAGDMIVYFSALNDAQMIIVQNYLAAKYNVALSSNDVYTMDNAANGDYDYEVAGIGRVDAANIHNDAQGTGIVRILNPVGLGDGEYYMWGHDNGTLGSWITSDYPASQGLQGRLVRIWRGSEVGAITGFDVRFDLTGLGPVTASDLRLLVDMNNNGIFSDETVAGGGVISGATAIGGNVYQFAGVTAMNNNLRFTLGTINTAQTPLPVELLSFDALLQNNYVNVNWETASEKNSDYFEVEKSSDAVNFKFVEKIKGAGNSNSNKKYKSIDNAPYDGISYYRLKQVDNDKNFIYSNVVSVNYIKEKNIRFSIFPNPNKGEFTADMSGIGNNTEVRIVLTNSAGDEVYNSSFYISDLNEGCIQIVPQSKLGSGVYICTLIVEGAEYHVKVIVS